MPGAGRGNQWAAAGGAKPAARWGWRLRLIAPFTIHWLFFAPSLCPVSYLTALYCLIVDQLMPIKCFFLLLFSGPLQQGTWSPVYVFVSTIYELELLPTDISFMLVYVDDLSVSTRIPRDNLFWYLHTACLRFYFFLSWHEMVLVTK